MRESEANQKKNNLYRIEFNCQVLNQPGLSSELAEKQNRRSPKYTLERDGVAGQRKEMDRLKEGQEKRHCHKELRKIGKGRTLYNIQLENVDCRLPSGIKDEPINW